MVQGTDYVLLDLYKDVKSAMFLSNFKKYRSIEECSKINGVKYYRTRVSLSDFSSKRCMQKYLDAVISSYEGIYTFGAILRWSTYGTLEFLLLRLEQ